MPTRARSGHPNGRARFGYLTPDRATVTTGASVFEAGPRHVPLEGCPLRRRTLIGVVLGLLVVVSLAVGGFVWNTNRLRETTAEYTYDYRVVVSVNGTLTDATLYLPLPTADGESPVGRAVVAGGPNVSRPDRWTYDVVDTRYGPMLAISAAEVNRCRPTSRSSPTGPKASRT